MINKIFVVLVFNGLLSFSLLSGEIDSTFLFKVKVDSPNAVEICGGVLNVSSVKDRKIYKIDMKSGSIKSSLTIPSKLKVTALGCFKGVLYVGAIENYGEVIYRAKGKRFKKIKTNIDGYIRDISCDDTSCLVVANRPYYGNAFNKLKKIEEIKITRGTIVRGGHALLKGFDQKIQVQVGAEKKSFGSWGGCEKEFVYPKSITSVGDDLLLISDVGLGSLFLFDKKGEYYGKIGNSKNFSGFDYPIDIISSKSTVFVADFLAHAVYGIKSTFNKGLTVHGCQKVSAYQSGTAKNILETVRCLNCHDGSEIYSLDSFTSLRNHHPTQVSFAKKRIDLPLGDKKLVTCRTCHDEHHLATEGMVIDKTGKSRQGILPKYLRKNGKDLCVTCHEEHGKPDKNHIGLSKGDRSLDVNSCLQCHQMHSGSDNLLGGGGCLSCHSNSKPKSHPFGTAKNGMNIECIYCHNVHDSSVSSKFTIKGSSNKSSCSSCHSQVISKGHQNKHIDMGLDCTYCHNPHKGKASLIQTCSKCHAEKKFTHMDLSSMQGLAKGVVITGGKMTCTTCHVQHSNKSKAKLLRKNTNIKKMCVMCHGDAKTKMLYKKFHSKSKRR